MPVSSKKVDKNAEVALAGDSVARTSATNQRVPGVILVKGTYLGCRFPTPVRVHVGRRQLIDVALSRQRFSLLSFSPSPSLSLKTMEEIASSKN